MLSSLRASRILSPALRRLASTGPAPGFNFTPSTRNKFVGFALASGAAAFGTAAAAGDAPPAALSPKEFREFAVQKTKRISPNTVLIRFALPSPDHVLGLTAISCLSIEADIDGQTVSRPYTPISTRTQRGHADFVVKAYPPRDDGKPGGMGAHINSLQPGDTVRMKGPWKKLDYEPNQHKEIGMVAGGTGLTPMLQVIQEVLYDPRDATRVTLLLANRSEQDILLRDRLDALAELYPDQFRVVHTIDQGSPGWQGETGHVNAAMVRKHLPAPAGDGSVRIMVCGPPPMMNAVCGPKGPKKTQGELSGVLKDVGYTIEEVFKF
jgi:cytochrome-b5 reductase